MRLQESGWITPRAIRLALFLVLFFSEAQSQDADVKYCGQPFMMGLFFENHPEARDSYEREDAALELETANFSNADRDELLIIPVVFHVIHNNGIENISNDQLFSAIEVLNRDYRKLNTDVDDVIVAFEDIVADVEVEFRLAQRDPNGNCHLGINRVVSALTYEGSNDVKDLVAWPRASYLNVWVVENANGAAGYSYYPSAVNGWQGQNIDGIVISHDYTGDTGTSNTYRSRTLTHEVGHWANLRHLWGNSNNPGEDENCEEDDNVDDTPETLGWISCNLNGETCGSLDNVQNYMEYSYCGRMLTEGQKTRIRAALYSSTAQRNQLWTSQNLSDTGVDGDPILCEVAFDADRRTICVGDTIQFTDASFHGPTNWAWDFGDGTQISGGDEEAQHPVHSYDEPGMYNVTLTISNGVEEISSTEQGFIQVLPTNAIDLPFADDFETSELDTETWFVRDVALDGDTWELTNNASVSGTQGMFISNWADGVMYGRDQLISSTMDLSGMDEVHISYKWSFCFKGNEETDDRLKVYASTDCGKTWSLRRMHRGFTDLPSAPPHSFNFTPDGEDEWAEYTLVLPYEQFMVENFRLMFEFESRLGNNLYFDDVNIVAYGPADVLEMEAATGVVPELYPNPTSGQTDLRFNLRTSRSVGVSVKDASGRLLKETRYGRLEAGEHVLSLDLRGWPRGLYFIEIKADAARRTSRLILAGIG